MLYILIFLAVWTIAFFIARNAKGSEYACMVALLLFVGGFASFSVSVNHVVLPYLRQHTDASQALLEAGRILGIASLYFYYYFFYYVFFIKAVLISGLFRKREKRLICILSLAIPLWFLFIQLINNPAAELDVQSIRNWSIFFLAFGCVGYVIGYIREKNTIKKQDIVRNGFILTAASIWGFMTDFVSIEAVSVDTEDFIFASFILFVYFATRHGLFGVKVKIERQTMDHSMRAIMKGTAILNHALRNEIVKINFIGERINYLLDNEDKQGAKESLTHLFNITDQMIVMFGKIRDQMEDIVLRRSTVRVNELIDSMIGQMQPLLDSKNIKVQRRYMCDVELMCDPNHVTEVLNNLSINAVDAMERDDGLLEFQTMTKGKQLLITVRDNGAGIPIEMVNEVFTPFFSTKGSHSIHSGLGLSYCYNVMQKHGGSIQILETEVGKGTTFGLAFPLGERRVLFRSFNKSLLPFRKE